MGEVTGIAWTDHTFNPWRGCTKVSPGCANCYAETMSKRNPAVLGEWGPNGKRAIAAESYWREPLRWNRNAKRDGVRRRVFCASLADVFEGRLDLNEPRARLFRLIEATPALDWLLLTKRPENAVPLAAAAGWPVAWPDNVWAGITAEDQLRVDERIPHLAAIPAAVRFVSYEPAIGAVSLRWSATFRENPCGRAVNPDADSTNEHDGLRRLDWVIVGGESGPHARPFDVKWARTVASQCRAAGVAFFMKQMGSAAGLRDRAGADPEEWPEDLRVRQFPAVSR